MNIVEIRREADLYDMRPAWEALLRSSAADTIFLSWEWISSWWQSYGQPGDLRILTVSDASGALRGIAPLRARTIRRYGQSYPVLTFLGDGSMDSDYLDFIVAPGYEKPVLEAFHRHWTTERSSGILLLNEIPETSPNLPLLRQLATRERLLWREQDAPCGAVPLPDTWEAYLALLKPRFRTKLRSALRNLEGRPEVRFGFCQDPEVLHRLLAALFDLHTRRWAQQGKPGVFGYPGKRDFYQRLSQLVLDRDWLRFSWVEWNGRVLACQYGFEYGGKYLQLQEGYEPASEHWNVGIALRAWSIREFIRRGVREYDFLGGVGRHKTDWGAQVKQSKQVLAALPHWRNTLFAAGPEWERSIKDFVKPLVPARVLAARAARLDRKRRRLYAAADDSVIPAAGATNWKRNLAAACYVRLGLPAVMRRLRNQYQLTVAANGADTLSWSRRQRPSARILYYHRVNPHSDPLCPAIHPALFERQMRYLKDHYRVISLSEIAPHLASGTPGLAVAITFDDGYQDNYQYAFPILRRYGLPATIFLATGGIDAREPLWFEQLARSIQATAREFIDLEIDVPRRFPLSTQADRVRSNAGIFSLLRGLPDEERRRWLTYIFAALGVSSRDRTDDMLTWDQVRLMKRHRIDFGGHTVTHPFVSKLTETAALWEISECKRRIEDELQQPVDFFAYPNGRDQDFSPASKDLVRRAGYRAAMTTIWGLNYDSTDPMEWKRGGPWEQTLEMFAYKLDWYNLVND